jgi:hypothetical protein
MFILRSAGFHCQRRTSAASRRSAFDARKRRGVADRARIVRADAAIPEPIPGGSPISAPLPGTRSDDDQPPLQQPTLAPRAADVALTTTSHFASFLSSKEIGVFVRGNHFSVAT